MLPVRLHPPYKYTYGMTINCVYEPYYAMNQTFNWTCLVPCNFGSILTGFDWGDMECFINSKPPLHVADLLLWKQNHRWKESKSHALCVFVRLYETPAEEKHQQSRHGDQNRERKGLSHNHLNFICKTLSSVAKLAFKTSQNYHRFPVSFLSSSIQN